MKVFISGPMSGYPNWNVEAFEAAERYLRSQGYDVFNPAWMKFGDGWTHDEILDIDLFALEKCQAIYQLKGWEHSDGAMQEYGKARKLGLILMREKEGDLESRGMLSWAENEVRLACERERGDKSENEWDYGCACYESALKAFKSLCDDGHSGYSIGFTKQILNRLIDHRALSPIEDTEDAWNEVTEWKTVNEYGRKRKTYQCKRMSSLFKDVYSDGKIEYHDVDRFVMVDKISNTTWSSGLVNKVLGEIYPVTMPYIPEDKPYKAICEEYLTDRKNGDVDTVGILWVQEPDGKKVDIYRFFKDAAEDGWDEIDAKEFEERIKMHMEREKEEAEL